ncbi:hypothetical protein DL770_009977 [Monosporascus sp. CRB-9-2]|nr:hypothetical protein DL770_009977 [Monosporascus sp. CRB-9-2]
MQPQTHYVIVAFETSMVPVPDFNLPAPYTCEVRQYERTSLDQIPERIRDADIVTLSVLPLRAEVLDAAVSPRLKMVAVVASGTDSIDKEACRSRGIVVSNTPHCNARSVAEHTIALYFDARRSLTLTHSLIRAGQWIERKSLAKSLAGPDGKPPRTCQSETVGIIGYGAVGKAIESIAKNLGMKTLISGRKGQPTADGRTPFDTVIRESSVIILCLPQNRDTVNLISEPEFNAMKSYAIVINVSRAGVMNEEALVAALKARNIAGAAVDVHSKEPAGPGDSPLFAPDTAELNLIATPHTAWVAEDTNLNYQRSLVENIASWLTIGHPKFQVV